MNKHELKTFVSNCFPSIFTKDDVIKLIDMLEDEKTSDLENPVTIEHLSDYLAQYLEDETSDLIDFDTAEFEIRNHNELSLYEINFDSHRLRMNIKSGIENFSSNYNDDY